VRALPIVLPFIPFLAGLLWSIERFRARDQLGGLLVGEGGVVLFLVLAVVTDRLRPGPRVAAGHGQPARELVGVTPSVGAVGGGQPPSV
jgi:hypothetical protein